MENQLKHIASLFLIGILALSGLSITFQHLNCNHCDVFSTTNYTENKEVSSCCMHSDTSMPDSSPHAETNCYCSQNISIAEQNKDIQTIPPIYSSLKVVLFTCLLFLFNFLRIPVIQRLFSSFKTSSAYIASGRQILSLNAILLI